MFVSRPYEQTIRKHRWRLRRRIYTTVTQRVRRRSVGDARPFAYSGAMSSSTLHRRIAALAIAGAALLGLTACSGLPLGSPVVGPSSSSTTPPAAESTEAPADDVGGDEGQSTADACRLVADTISQATDEFGNLAADDPAAVVGAMEAAAQQIAETSSQITNDEVAALLPPLQEMFQQVADVMRAVGEGDVSRIAEIEELGTTFQETSQQFQELCAP